MDIILGKIGLISDGYRSTKLTDLQNWLFSQSYQFISISIFGTIMAC